MDKTKRNVVPLTVYIEPERYEEIKKQASKNGCSISSYVNKCIPESDEEILSGSARASLLLKGLYGFDSPISDGVERTRPVKVFFSDEEYEYLKKISGRMSISAFVRKTLLTAGNNRFVMDIRTDDLDALARSMDEIGIKIGSFLSPMRYRKELYSSDIERFETFLKEINDKYTTLIKRTRRDREYIREEGYEYLIEQIDRLINSAGSDNSEEKEAGGYDSDL